MDFASILNNEITHMVFGLIIGVAGMLALILLLLALDRWFRR